MRFNNDDYLRAFPRDDRTPATPATQPATPATQPAQETPAGDVFDQGKEPEDKQDPITDPEPEGGAEDGDE